VTSISALVHIYSVSYMKEDPHLQRFMGLLSLFTFFMVWLVTSTSLIQLFIGWEGIGVVSYLLVNFWYTRMAANRSAMMALLTNRVGDWGYSLGMFALIGTIASLDFATWFGVAWGYNHGVNEIICCLLVIGVVGKSSQIGLHTWLPWAMEGPTPVSALLHAATLVTAGIFLLLRISPVLEFAPQTLTILTFLGGFTAFLGGSLGLVANDMKKVIAYSTMSQLGYMVYAIGISAYSVSLYHLINHAYFKALLFLSAGSLIHALSDEQDLRRMGALRKILAFTYVAMTIGSISLMGIPFTSGFYSKENILGLGYSSESLAAGVGYWLCLISALFTTIYSIRLLSTGFLVTGNENRPNLLKGSHEPELNLTFCLGVLAVASVSMGYLLSDIFSNSSDLFKESLYQDAHHLTNTHLGGSLYPLAATLIGAIAASLLNIWFPGTGLKVKTSTLGSMVYRLLINRYYFDAWFSVLTKYSLKLGWITAKSLDKGLGEFLGPTGIYNLFHKNPKTSLTLNSFYINNESLSVFQESKLPHFLISKSPILYGQYIIFSLFLTLASLNILYS